MFASLGAIGKADGKYGPALPAHLGGVSTESTPRVPLDYPWSTPGVPLVYPLNDLIGAGTAQRRLAHLRADTKRESPPQSEYSEYPPSPTPTSAPGLHGPTAGPHRSTR